MYLLVSRHLQSQKEGGGLLCFLPLLSSPHLPAPHAHTSRTYEMFYENPQKRPGKFEISYPSIRSAIRGPSDSATAGAFPGWKSEPAEL
jgi:hypothetical protein